MIKHIISLLLILQFLILNAQYLPYADSNWILIPEKSDEFEGEIIDSTKWGHQLWFSCSRELAFTSNNVIVENGFAIIQIKDQTIEMDKSLGQCDRGIYYKTSGAIISNFEVEGESYIEWRVKLVDYRADLTSAIWISDEPVPHKNPNLEIDVLETLNARSKPKWFSSAMHIWHHFAKYSPENRHQKLDGKKYKLKKKHSEDFIVLGLERRGDWVRMYVDGKLFWERNMLDYPDFLDQARRIIVNVEGHDGRPKKGDYKKELLIDYIRTYTYTGTP